MGSEAARTAITVTEMAETSFMVRKDDLIVTRESASKKECKAEKKREKYSDRIELRTQ